MILMQTLLRNKSVLYTSLHTDNKLDRKDDLSSLVEVIHMHIHYSIIDYNVVVV